MRRSELPVWDSKTGANPRRLTILLALRDIHDFNRDNIRRIMAIAKQGNASARVGVLITTDDTEKGDKAEQFIGIDCQKDNNETQVRIVRAPCRIEDYSHASGINTLMAIFPFGWAIERRSEVEYDDIVALLHDDVLFKEESPELNFHWLYSEIGDLLLTPGVGLVVPRMVGSCPSPIQSMTIERAGTVGLHYDCTEYVSEDALFFLASTYRKWVGRIPDRMMGYQMHGTHIQKRMGMASLRTLVFHPLPVSRIHLGTYIKHYVNGNVEAKKRELRERRWFNLRAYCQENVVGFEYDLRPGENRIAVAGVRHSWAMVADSRSQVLSMMKQAKAPPDEWAIIDASADLRLFSLYKELRQSGKYRRVSYLPAPDGACIKNGDFLERYATSMLSSNDVRVSDLRRNPTFPTSEGRRVRSGFDYVPLPSAKVLHLGFLSGCGIGDLLLSTPGIAAVKRLYPHIRIECHASWDCVDVFKSNPDVDATHCYNPSVKYPPVDVFPASGGNAREGTIRHLFQALSLPHKEQSDRRLRLFLTPEEINGAIAKLRLDASVPLVGNEHLVCVQVHGSWATKEWEHLPAFVELLLASAPAARVVLIGHDIGRGHGISRVLDHDRIIPLMNHGTIREALAVVALSDWFVGFDSGLTVAAAGLGTSLVALVGSHNPRGLIGDAHGPNMVFIRKRTPEHCMKKYGRSCRKSFDLYGQDCPLRAEGVGGADCIDDITPEYVYKQLSGLPTFEGKPLEERYAKPTYYQGRFGNPT